MGLHRVEWWWGIALALVLLVIAMPMRTSLGQGIEEFKVLNWQGEYQVDTGHFFLRVNGAASAPIRIRIPSMPTRDFTQHQALTWFTKPNLPSVMQKAFETHPQQVESALGTHDNVFTMHAVFPRQPVAYTAGFLRALKRMGVNPKVWGGPDVPPRGLAIHDTILQIDTRPDADTLVQCGPGVMPPELQVWRTHLR